MKKSPFLYYVQNYIAYDEISGKSFILAIAATILSIVSVTQLVNNLNNATKFWDAWTLDADYTTFPVYPENVYWNEIIRTRSNTWSNFFYIFVGYFALCAGVFDLLNYHRQVRSLMPSQSSISSNYLLGNAPLSILYGAGCIHLGLSSGLYHASLSRLGRQLDVASMYSPLMVLIAIGLGRWSPYFIIPPGTCGINNGFAMPKWIIHTFIIIISAYLFYEYKWYMDSAIVLPVLIISAYGVAIADRVYFPQRLLELKWMTLSFIALIVGFVCRILDVNRLFVLADSNSYIQGHAVWHFLTSLSLYWMYLHHRSEPFNPQHVLKFTLTSSHSMNHTQKVLLNQVV